MTTNIPPIIKPEPRPLYPKKINAWEGSVLPHQKSDLKPDEIVEHTQEPPEEYISPDRREEAEIHHRNQIVYKELKKMEDERLTGLHETSKKIKKNLKDLQSVITD